jgi:DNA-binding transcriptional MerR regulator
MRRYDVVSPSGVRQELTLEVVAVSAGMHPALVKQFVELGLIEPIEWENTVYFFDASAVPRLRTINQLRSCLGVNTAGVAVILDLLDKIHALHRENESLRSRL